MHGETWDEQLAQIAMEIQEWPADKPIDYAKLTRKVLLSEPPTASDVETHVKFAKVWGGGKQQHMTKDICTYMKLCEQILDVPVKMFDTLCALKLNPAELPTRFVCATIKAMATRSNVNAMPSARLKDIASDKKVQAMAANAFMEKAMQMIGESDDTAMIKARGDLECDLVEFVLDCMNVDKQKKKSKIKMEHIVEGFVKKVDALRRGQTPDPQQRDIDPAPVADLMFDSTAPDAVQEILKRQGIVQGAVLQAQSDQFAMENQYVVNNLNEDGSMGVHKIDVDGKPELQGKTLIKIKMGEISKFKVMKPSDRMTVLCKALPNLQETGTWHRVVAEIALHKLFVQFQTGMHRFVTQGAPKVRLLARQQIETGSLTLVPWSSSLTMMKQAKTESNNNPDKIDHRVIEVMTTPPKIFSINSPEGLGKSFEVPFWRMKEENKDAKHANMKWDVSTQTINWPVDIGLGKTVSVNVCVATNTKIIKPNTEIRIFSPINKKRPATTSVVCLDSFVSSKKLKGSLPSSSKD